MTDPSEMTNDELRLAIAEIIAKENGWTIRDDLPIEEIAFINSKGELEGFAPYYPGDPAAALGLLDEYDEVDIWKDSTGWNCAFDKAFCHGKSFARAISEAWLKEKRGNDG